MTPINFSQIHQQNAGKNSLDGLIDNTRTVALRNQPDTTKIVNTFENLKVDDVIWMS
jgi:hypothetical protein